MTPTNLTEPQVPLPTAKMHLYRPNEPVTVKVTKSETCTGPKSAAYVRHVEFDVSGTSLAGSVLPGQSIGVLAPGTDAKGRPHAVRLYSVASPTRGESGGEVGGVEVTGRSGAGPGTIISTTVKRTIDEHWESHKLFLGVCSNYLCDLKVGDDVRLSGPNGKNFLLPIDQPAHDYLFFATGTGIAPFRGMVIDLLERKVPSKITLVMGSPYATDLLYDDLFRRLASEHPNFQYLTAISREKQADGNGPMYVQDRIAASRDQLMPLLASERTLVYVCGIAGMELGIFRKMGSTLPSHTLEQYLRVPAEALADVGSWDRKMLYRVIKPTKRVFLEVYE